MEVLIGGVVVGLVVVDRLESVCELKTAGHRKGVQLAHLSTQRRAVHGSLSLPVEAGSQPGPLSMEAAVALPAAAMPQPQRLQLPATDAVEL